MPRGREPAWVAAVTNEGRGEDRSDAVEVGERRVRGEHGFGDAILGALEFRVEAADVIELFVSELEPLSLAGRCDPFSASC